MRQRLFIINPYASFATATSNGTPRPRTNPSVLSEIQYGNGGNDKLHFSYDAQNRPALVNFNGTTYTYVHNLQGDIVGILDSTGTLVVEYKYDAWGRPLSTSGASANTLGKLNPFRYRGYVYDEETGFYYLKSRYYSSEILRFLNEDILISNSLKLLLCNIFSYCTNNPVNYLDENGYSKLGITTWNLWKQYAPTISYSDGPFYIGEAVAIASLTIVGGAYVIDGLINGINSLTNLFADSKADSPEEELEDIAGQYDDYQCTQARDSMIDYLKTQNHNGYIVSIQYPATPGYIYTITYNRLISTNGFHCGVEYNGLVYCNVHPYGLEYNAWVADFEAIGTKSVTKVPF